ncbi:MAG: hypothetical protein ACOC84_06585 [Actinomycetota bacterium]
MSDFVQRLAAGSGARRATRSVPRPTAAAASPEVGPASEAGRDTPVRVDGRTLHRARTSDGRTVLVDSELRKDIIEAAARLASGR